MRGREIEVKRGTIFIICIESNPSTGYSWELEYDEHLLRLKGRDFERSSEAVGAGGTEKIRFLPIGAGIALVKLRLKRPWEGTVVEEKTHRIDIKE